jgi:hypothetical protein
MIITSFNQSYRVVSKQGSIQLANTVDLHAEAQTKNNTTY